MDIFEKINYDNVEKKGYFLGLREEDVQMCSGRKKKMVVFIRDDFG